jgi:glucoamylase
MESRWASSAKEGVGTAYHTSCRVWFTLSHGIVNEIYYPQVDRPNTRDFQFLITDGRTFCHEERRDLEHGVEYPERDCPFYRLVNTDRGGRYRVVKHVLADPHRSVLLVRTRVEIRDEALRGKLRLVALLAPHGNDNSGRCMEIGEMTLMHAQCAGPEDVHLVMGCTCGFVRRSIGYVGASDGWQDLMGNFEMDWEFKSATNGNIALTGEIALPEDGEFTIAVACGGSCQSTAAKLLQSLSEPFEAHREGYVRQWQRAVVCPQFEFSGDTGDGGGMYRLSRCVLLCHEDKVFQGALVASMSIPWGETKGDDDRGGYHLVWTRDLVQSATALLATGQTGTPLRALMWLAAIQNTDGSFPQNSWIDGTAYWSGLQLDEIAAPLLLAWRLYKQGVSLQLFNPRVLMMRAAAYLMLQGPVTSQERWEENAGYSPSTLATVIAALVCGAECATEHKYRSVADFILVYADWLAAHLEDWTVTTAGELVAGQPRHYIRINPTDARAPDAHADPNRTMIQLANGGGLRPARNVVSGDFLHLVRFGIRAANDPVVLDSLAVIDRVIKRDLPQGPGWRRYNHDGYGQKDDGGAFDGTGTGRCWPILTGERGHYEVAAGRDALPFIQAMERFANEGGMISEQLWDAADLPNGSMRLGLPTGAAMPLCWSHAEYISLVRSRHDGVCFDRVEPAYDRYVAHPVASRHEVWTRRHGLRRLERGKILRIILAAQATVMWSTDDWEHTQPAEMIHEKGLELWYADFASAEWPVGSAFTFALYQPDDPAWEERKWRIVIGNEDIMHGNGQTEH